MLRPGGNGSYFEVPAFNGSYFEVRIFGGSYTEVPAFGGSYFEVPAFGGSYIEVPSVSTVLWLKVDWFSKLAFSRPAQRARWWPLCTPGMAGSCAVRRIAPCSHAAQLPRPSGLFRTRGTVPPLACDQAIRFQAI